MSNEKVVLRSAVEPSGVTPAEIIPFIQQRRLDMLMGRIEEDKVGVAIMTGMAKTAMDEARIMVDESGAKAQQEIAAVLATLVSRGGGNPFMGIGNSLVDSRPITLDHKDLPPIVLVEGETSTGQSALTYKDLYSDDA